MTEVDLLQALARGEDSRQQFKRDATNADGMAAELAALANSGGGTVFLGVADDGSIAGLDAASQHVRPPLHPQTDNVQTAQGLVLVLVVQVPNGLSKPYMDLQGRVWVKSGADSDERAFGCYFEWGMAFIKRSLHKVQAGRACQQIRTGVSNCGDQKYRLSAAGKAYAARGDAP